MSKCFPHLFEPITINGLTLPNRIAKAPQSSGMNNKDGTVSERALRYYRDQAAGGTGMIIVEYAYVDEIGSKSAHCHLGISSDEHIPGLAWLAENIEEMGAVPAIQIEHCGRQKFLGTQPIKAPSAIAWPTLYAQHGLEAVPQELTIPEIHEIVKCFGDAALRAKKAGFKLVEIHGAHGYLLTNFFSPTTNHRTDMYGGTLENRARIYFEVLEDIRRKVGPDYPVTIRLSGTDYEPDGFPIEDTIWLAKELEKRGLDGINVSGGDHHTMIHQVTPMSLSLCHNTWAAEAIKKEVNIPVMASGSITLPQYAEDIIASGKGDMVVLGRPLWADPDWSQKAKEDRPEDICPCIRCNEGCLERTFFQYKAVTCAVNPVISREGELKITPAPKPRRVAVVGGGAAGMEAARVAKLRGHDVTIFEAQQRMGGLLNEAAAPEFKADIRPFQKYLETQVEKLGIPVVRKRAELADLQEYDAVICATGSLPFIGNIPGKENALDALTAINHPEKVGKKVVMIGGGLVGTETALDLAENGHDVTIVEMLPRIMNDVATTDLIAYSERIAKTDMKVLTDTRLERVTEKGAVVSARKQGERELEADTVILALGFRSCNELYQQLKAAGKEAYLVGDAVKPGKIFDAVHTGYRAGLKV
ncbi:MAG: FAD-dependent oxidoreductase [Clostridia bacterium]|nr:FAD-dependent oxidoreductase [Clostridia bacterium]